MEKQLTVMIVDDEQEAIDYLVLLLKEDCPHLKIVATANTTCDAISKVFRKHPDLIFLDIEIDSKNGFDLIHELATENHRPHIIFVTAYSRYAIDAFKTNALDYLLKPVESKDLQRAVNRFIQLKELESYAKKIDLFVNNFQPKLRFNTSKGFILINPNDIIYCQSDGNYSEIYLIDNSKSVVCYNLKKLFKDLPQPQFRRISRYNIINDNYLVEVDRGKQKCILRVDQQEISLSYSQKMMQ